MNYPIELLAPAKNLECVIAAIDAGADAVYIGAPQFGARSAAGNSLEDIEKAVHYAHLYYCKLYVTLNTLLFDSELSSVEKLIHDLYKIGVDAVIIQDMGILELKLPPIPIFASTQCHNDAPKKVLFLEKAGFSRVILARELSLNEIKEIRSRTEIELECFIHGALCVSYSGQCTMSYASGGRSGNRGECAQPCRMSYDLIDGEGKTIVRNKHLLSLKDLNLSGSLEELLDAGVTSFKVEGRLKDVNYIKNIVGFYRKELDRLIDKKGLRKSSSGKTELPFEPQPDKSFNRGFTDYFLHGRRSGIASFDTQKSIGEPIGTVEKVDRDCFHLVSQGNKKLIPGDGICFFDKNRVLCGMFVNAVEGNKVYPRDNRFIFAGAMIYRNSDLAFNKILESMKIIRSVGVKMTFSETGTGFRIFSEDQDGNRAESLFNYDKTPANNPENAEQTLRKQLSKSGDTIFSIHTLKLELKNYYFFPVSVINEWRRFNLQILEENRASRCPREEKEIVPTDHNYPNRYLDFCGNVLNDKARDFYRRHGVLKIEPAAESGIDMAGKTLMTTRHCIRYESGFCLRNPEGKNWKAPLYISDRKRNFELSFDCERCVMEVRSAAEPGK